MVNNITLLFDGYNSQLCSSLFHSIKIFYYHILSLYSYMYIYIILYTFSFL